MGLFTSIAARFQTRTILCNLPEEWIALLEDVLHASLNQGIIFRVGQDIELFFTNGFEYKFDHLLARHPGLYNVSQFMQVLLDLLDLFGIEGLAGRWFLQPGRSVAFAFQYARVDPPWQSMETFTRGEPCASEKYRFSDRATGLPPASTPALLHSKLTRLF